MQIYVIQTMSTFKISTQGNVNPKISTNSRTRTAERIAQETHSKPNGFFFQKGKKVMCIVNRAGQVEFTCLCGQFSAQTTLLSLT